MLSDFEPFLQTMGSVDVPQEAFMAVLSIDRAQE